MPELPNMNATSLPYGLAGLAKSAKRATRAAARGLAIASLTSLLMGLCTNQASAQGAEPIDIKLKAELIKTDKEGKEERLPADKAEPGDLIVYTVTCKNTSERVITDLKPVVPIPAEMELQKESAEPKATEGSVDGATFAALPIKRDVKQEDGTAKSEPVPAASYRAIRWNIAELKPAEAAEVSVRVRVKATAATPAAAAATASPAK